MKPMFMWAGGKAKMFKHYQPFQPSDFSHYVEPFLGGGFMFSNIQKPVQASLNDLNFEIMGIYKCVRDDFEEFRNVVKSYEEVWDKTPLEERKSLYYQWRQSYWERRIPKPFEDGSEISGLLYVLMKRSFNGFWKLCQKSEGLFGTPCGLVHLRTCSADFENIQKWSEALQSVFLSSVSFEEVSVPKSSWVFCDPPYRGSIADYGKNVSDEFQERVLEWCVETSRETKSEVWLCNRELHDGFFENRVKRPDLIKTFPVTYTAGRRKKREDGGFDAVKAQEVLIIWKDGQQV